VNRVALIDTAFVAFFRNVNLGQRNSPTRTQLESAFLEAGARSARSFQTNGTLVFVPGQQNLAEDTARCAADILKATCALKEPVFTCRLDALARLVHEDPMASFKDAGFFAGYLTLFKPGLEKTLTLPLESARRDCLVFYVEEGLALSVSRVLDGKAGDPTPMLERIFGAPVTTRSWNTITRLVRKFS